MTPDRWPAGALERLARDLQRPSRRLYADGTSGALWPENVSPLNARALVDLERRAWVSRGRGGVE